MKTWTTPDRERDTRDPVFSAFAFATALVFAWVGYWTFLR